MPKRRCGFTDSLEAEYWFLKEKQEVGKVLCSICKSQFSIEHGGRSDILQHIERVFAITNALWTDEKSHFLVETIRVVIVRKTHFEEHLCKDFYTMISNNPK
jgi:hypothetical protein